jgi:hypothetical protein
LRSSTSHILASKHALLTSRGKSPPRGPSSHLPLLHTVFTLPTLSLLSATAIVHPACLRHGCAGAAGGPAVALRAAAG